MRLTCGTSLPCRYDDNQDVDGDRKRPLLAEEVYNIFKGISDDDCRLLGLNPVFARPDWLVCTVLPVPPPHVRPPVALDNMSRSQDDLTYKLADIIKANTGLKNALNKGEPTTIVNECVHGPDVKHVPSRGPTHPFPPPLPRPRSHHTGTRSCFSTTSRRSWTTSCQGSRRPSSAVARRC